MATDWFTVNAWDRLAETCGQYLSKGAKVYIDGRLRNRSREGRDGQKRTVTEVVVSELIMLDSRQAAGTVAGDEQVEESDPKGTGPPF